eukprot:749938-Hanusia_phi.AAC.5
MKEVDVAMRQRQKSSQNQDYTEFLALSFAASSTADNTKHEDQGSVGITAVSQSQNTTPPDGASAQSKPTAGLKFSVPTSWVEESKPSVHATQETGQDISMAPSEAMHSEPEPPRKVWKEFQQVTYSESKLHQVKESSNAIKKHDKKKKVIQEKEPEVNELGIVDDLSGFYSDEEASVSKKKAGKKSQKNSAVVWSDDDSDNDDSRAGRKETVPITPSSGGSEGGADFTDPDKKKDKKDKKVPAYNFSASLRMWHDRPRKTRNPRRRRGKIDRAVSASEPYPLNLLLLLQPSELALQCSITSTVRDKPGGGRTVRARPKLTPGPASKSGFVEAGRVECSRSDAPRNDEEAAKLCRTGGKES